MVEKRKLSTRIRSEPAWKRRSPSPKIEEPELSPEPVPGAELPSKLRVGMPLPTTAEPQVQGPPSDYQSFVESGVVAKSLQRSRQTWLSDGIFKLYWAKPYKKRLDIDPRNPPKENMTKIGLCTLTIEPHSFECTVFIVRDSLLSDQDTPPLTQTPAFHPSSAPGTQANISSSTSIAQSQSAQTPAHLHHRRNSSLDTPKVKQEPDVSGQEINLAPTSGPRTIQQTYAPKPSPDPVIQMLASRAATDTTLKELMKVVASGAATNAELRVFSAHIDDLNAILRESQAQKEIRSMQASRLSRPESAYPPIEPRGGSTFASPALHPSYSSDGKPKTPVIPKGDITAVALEFSAGSGDRFLFPRQSILEYRAGGTQVVASFLVIRKGNKAYGGQYDDQTDYYYPVTIRLRAHHSRILEPLSKVVASPDHVSRYMVETIEKYPRADAAFLAMKLPKATLGDEEEDDVQMIEDASTGQVSAAAAFGGRKKRGKRGFND